MIGSGGFERAALETGQGHDRLEGRTRRELRLNGAVEQGIVRIVIDFLPGLRADVPGEESRIERRAADHRQYLTRSGIERDHRAFAALHGDFRHALQIDIEGGLQIVAGRGLDVIQNLALTAGAIDHPPLHARLRP